jgi:signal transduction histidine kinase
LNNFFDLIQRTIRQLVLSVPIRWKIIGIGVLPVLILGFSLNYWITTGLADWLSYILTDTRVEAAMNAGSRSVMFVTGIAAFLSIILLLLLVYILTNPIDTLKQTAKRVAAGEYHLRAEVWARDEIGSMAESVNQMIDNFVAIQEDLSETNRQLEAVNRIALAADRESEIHDVLFLTLESMLDLLGLEYGWVYLYDPEVHKMHLASWRGVPEAVQPALLQTDGGQPCESQRALEAGVLGGEIMVEQCRLLEGRGLQGVAAQHITIPIEARNIQFGVINLAFPQARELREDEIALLEAIGTKISEVVANAWLRIKLREKEAARQLLLESLVTAQEDERRHLARELHDQAGQGLTSLLIRLKALENMCEQDALKTKLTEMQGLVSGTIQEIRDLSYSLRPPALEEFGLGAAIVGLADEIASQTGLRIKVKNRIETKLPLNIEMVLYRIVQEGLTNVVRHAEAEKVVIELEPRENLVYLKLEDDGRGFDPVEVRPEDGRRHLGLISMNERAELIGGRLEMYSRVGAGTTIEVRVPLPELEMQNAI